MFNKLHLLVTDSQRLMKLSHKSLNTIWVYAKTVQVFVHIVISLHTL